MAITRRKNVAVGTSTTKRGVISKAKVDQVIAIKTLNQVVAVCLNILNRTRAHFGAGPQSAIIKLNIQRPARTIARTQSPDKHKTVTRAVEGQHQIIAVGSCTQCRNKIIDTVTGQDYPVHPTIKGVDPVVPITGRV